VIPLNIYERGIYEFATTLIEDAGKKLKTECQNLTITICEKTSYSDIVTTHDVFIEQFLTKTILKNYPEHSIMAEESYIFGNLSIEGYTWIIDPIDGTTNYCHSSKDYAISMALYRNEQPVFGFVYDVANELIYRGIDGEGSTLNGNKMNGLTRENTCLHNGIVSISFNTMNELNNKGMNVFDWLSQVRGYRYMGCASLELCKVAKGEYDLYISTNVYPWDIAAARILIEQCGGVFISCPKDKSVSQGGKLFVAAFHSSLLWEETLIYIPDSIKNEYFP